MIVPFYRTTRVAKLARLFCSANNLQVLGIESSCDDTSAGVVNSSKTILGENKFSQSRLHLEIGGVMAHVATDLHQQFLKEVVEKSMKQSCLAYKDLDAIAVTVKPGLKLSLLAGLEFGKELCRKHRKPMIPIHHMEAHALTGRLVEDVKFPFLTLLISGGHCLLALVNSADKFYLLGESLDASPGLILDKFARRAKLKNLKKFSGLVGGQAVEMAALEGDHTKFPISVMKCKGGDFSFSGIQTMGVYYVEKFEKDHDLEPDQVVPEIYDLCAAVQWAIAKHLCRRLESAINYVEIKKLLRDEKCVVVSGGVASNQFLRTALKFVCDVHDYKCVFPPPELCTDNGTMIAWNGIERLRENLPVVHPDDLDSVDFAMKCPLGENISSDLKEIAKCHTFSRIKEKDILNALRNAYPEKKKKKETNC